MSDEANVETISRQLVAPSGFAQMRRDISELRQDLSQVRQASRSCASRCRVLDEHDRMFADTLANTEDLVEGMRMPGQLIVQRGA